MNVREAREDERDAVLALRRTVFVGEQGVPLVDVEDASDAVATHLVMTADWDVVATCRLVPGSEGRLRLGWLAVAPRARRQGRARALLDDAAVRALAGGFERIVLHAQVDLVEMYARAGYVPTAATRTVAGVEHQTMELRVG